MAANRPPPCRAAKPVDGVGTTVYSYSAAGQLLTEDGPFASNTVTNTRSSRQTRQRRPEPGAAHFPISAFYSPNFTVQHTVNSLNELTSAPGFVGSQAYDGNGNLTNSHSGNWGYSYDAENRLISSYRQPEVILDPPHVTQFFYDGFSRLRIRQEWEWVPSIQDSPVGIDAPSGGGGGDGYWQLDSEVHYIYDGWRVIQERDGSNNPQVSYTRGNDLSGSMEGAGGIGGLLARSDGYSSGSWTDHNFYFADGVGNVTYMISGSQTMVASYRYDPFGNTISSSGSLASTNVYRFSSKEIHAASGLYYFGYRFYDPTTQRWIGRDPICEGGGINLYGFVLNNPMLLVDLMGLASDEPPDIPPMVWPSTTLTIGYGQSPRNNPPTPQNPTCPPPPDFNPTKNPLPPSGLIGFISNLINSTPPQILPIFWNPPDPFANDPPPGYNVPPTGTQGSILNSGLWLGFRGSRKF
jgi:RHS repeat-associated protein